MSSWRLGDLRGSRTPADSFRSALRADPYWDQMFPTGTSDGWVSASQYRQTIPAQRKWSGVPASYVMSREEALAELSTNRNRASILTALGAADSWRTVTREQLAAISGSDVLANPYPAALSAAYSAGLLSHGYVSSGPNRLAPRSRRMSMWAVGDDRSAYARYARTLTMAERISITGGTPWTAERRFERHNVLATELALRAAELTRVTTVLGEKQCSVASVLASTGNRVEKADDQRRADLGLVRPDGLTVFVEVTASSGHAFQRKMERWAQLLQRHPVYDLPVVVLVLDISTPQQQRVASPENSARALVRKTVLESVRQFPGSRTNRTASRIGYASWAEWFPDRHEIDDSFLSLTAHFPVGTDSRDHWERVPIMDTSAVPYAQGSAARAETLLANTRLLAGTPYWLRLGTRPDLGSWLLRQIESFDIVDSLPHRSEVSIPDRMSGVGFTRAVGGRRQADLVR